MENWKQFHGTEIGSYLAKIYGKQGNVSYPKLKEPNMKWSPEAKTTNSGKKEKTLVIAPKPSRKDGRRRIAPVDLIPKRRNEEKIKCEINAIAFQQLHYRPIPTAAISTDAEKERLSEICINHGGKGLSADFILQTRKLPGNAPSKSSNSAKNRIYTNENMSYQEALAMQLATEINDRLEHLHEMQQNSIITRAEEIIIEHEITTRKRQLQKIHLDIS